MVEVEQAVANSLRTEICDLEERRREVQDTWKRDNSAAQALTSWNHGLQGEERWSRAHLGEVQAHRRLPEAADAVTSALGGEQQFKRDRPQEFVRGIRVETDATHRHETESRLLRIKVKLGGSRQHGTGCGDAIPRT